MRVLTIIFFLIGCFQNVYSFGWEKCRTEVLNKAKGNSVLGIFMLSTSSAQFSTSTGECAMIGKVDHDKQVFFIQNFESLKIDSAKGGGEHIRSYASLAGCYGKAKKALPALFQNNYMEIYGISKKDPRAVYGSMEKVMRSDPIVSSGCYIQG